MHVAPTLTFSHTKHHHPLPRRAGTRELNFSHPDNHPAQAVTPLQTQE